MLSLSWYWCFWFLVVYCNFFLFSLFLSCIRCALHWGTSFPKHLVQVFELASNNYHQRSHVFLFRRGDMIKDMSKFDCVQGHTYGKCNVLPFKSTCCYKQTRGRTPSPTCVIDGATFQEDTRWNCSWEYVFWDAEWCHWTGHKVCNREYSAPQTAHNIITDVLQVQMSTSQPHSPCLSPIPATAFFYDLVM